VSSYQTYPFAQRCVYNRSVAFYTTGFQLYQYQLECTGNESAFALRFHAVFVQLTAMEQESVQ